MRTFALVFIFSLLACGGSDSGTCTGIPKSMVPSGAPCVSCVTASCAAEVTLAFGPNWQSGESGGACASYLSCAKSCGCDPTCVQSCQPTPSCSQALSAYLSCGLKQCAAACGVSMGLPG